VERNGMTTVDRRGDDLFASLIEAAVWIRAAVVIGILICVVFF